jgi:hypothetical protein
MKCYENWFVAAADQTIEADLKRREDVVGLGVSPAKCCFSSSSSNTTALLNPETVLEVHFVLPSMVFFLTLTL